MFAEYLGLDYSVALKLHLYHYVFRDLVRWAMTNGYKWFQSSGLNYDPKLHLRYRLKPVDLYVKHTSPLVNALLRPALPWLEPTRYDKTLKKFPNYSELWEAAAPGSSLTARKSRSMPMTPDVAREVVPAIARRSATTSGFVAALASTSTTEKACAISTC